MTFAAERAVRSRSFAVALPMARALRFFEPEGERAWAAGWDPKYLHPADGRTEAGMVFTTSHGGEETVWLMTRHDPQAGIVEYARMTPGSRIATVLVQCARLDAARTRVTVIYTFTALSDAGNAYVRAMDESHYGEMIDGWSRAIEEAAAR